MKTTNFIQRIYLFFFLFGFALITLSSCKKYDDDMMIDDNDIADLYVSSNLSGQVGIFDFNHMGGVSMKSATVMNADADGIYYDKKNDILYQLDRSNNRINAYYNASDIDDGDMLSPDVMSTSDFINGREIAVSGNWLVVAQDATDAVPLNKFYLYKIRPGMITLEKEFDSPINLWGIHAEGNNLFAIQDNSDTLAVFRNFFLQPSGKLQDPIKLQIEGIVRTHGITYDIENDIMVLTDVGSGADPEDGALHIIENFAAKSAAALKVGTSAQSKTGTISLADQVRIAGGSTLLGNPVDVAYSNAAGSIYVAERANNGGRLLVFDYPTMGGDVAPDFNMDFSGASAVYLNVVNVKN